MSFDFQRWHLGGRSEGAFQLLEADEHDNVPRSQTHKRWHEAAKYKRKTFSNGFGRKWKRINMAIIAKPENCKTQFLNILCI